MANLNPSEFGLRPVTLSEEERAKLVPAPQESEKENFPGLRPLPLETLSDEDLFKLSVDSRGKVSPVQYFYANRDRLSSNPEYVAKFANVYDRLRKRGFEVSDLPVVHQAAEAAKALSKGEIGKAVKQPFEAAKEVAVPAYHFGKGVAKQLWNYATALPISPLFLATVGEGKEAKQRKVAEAFAGTELAVTGLAQQGERLAGKIAAPFQGERTQSEKERALWSKVGELETNEQISRGKGGFLGSPLVGKYTIESLEQAGKGIRPEEVQALSSGDPFSLWAFGKLFRGAHRVVPAPVGRVVARVEGAASAAAPRAVGAVAEVVGTAAKKTAQVAKKVSPAAPAVGVITGFVKGGPVGGLAGATAGKTAQKVISTFANQAERIGIEMAKAGNSLRTAAPLGSYGQLVQDIAAAAPKVASELSKGAAIDFSLAAATAEMPEDTAHAVTLGTIFGLGRGVYRGGLQVVSGQIVAPRPWHSSTPQRSSGRFPVLDQIHNDAYRNAPPGVKVRIDGIRSLLRRSGASDDFYYVPSEELMTQALSEIGYDPVQASQIASSQGVTVNRPTAGGRNVVLVRDISSAPHESFHPIQDVLGERANRVVDEAVKASYRPEEWEAFGTDYAARILGIPADQFRQAGLDWREVILDRSGSGEQAAAEKILADTAEMLREPADSPAVTDAARDIFAEMVRNNGWRQVVPRNQRAEIADRYIARELAAEQWDAVLPNLGPELQSQSAPGTMARLLAGMISSLGGEPLGERVSTEGTPLRYRALQAATEAAKGITPAAAPRQEAPVSAFRGPEPVTPEQRAQAAQAARDAAQTASDVPLPGQTQSPQQMLGTIAEAIADQSAVRVNYRSAEGIPAGDPAAVFLARRAEIEQARNLPEDQRRLLEKISFPYSVIRTRNGRIQVRTYSPEVVASNAIRWAHSISDLMLRTADPVVRQNLAREIPYEIDPQAREFTPAGWQKLIGDLQVYASNLLSGRTGAGERIQVPEGLRRSGYFAPPETGEAQPLGVQEMNFLNMIHGYKPPVTPRIQGTRIPLNVAATEVSEATLPGRVSVPGLVEPVRRSTPGGMRRPFAGPRAEEAGIVPAGGERPILDPNPLRANLERTMQREGVPIPQTLEASQNLNLDHFANVEAEPLQARTVGGNVLTMTAGFQPGARVLPTTEARTAKGREAERKGFRVVQSGILGNRQVELIDAANEAPVGYIYSTSLTSPKTADIAMVKINQRYRGRGLGEVLYREMLSQLKEDGVERVEGMVVSEAPLRLREKIFGEGGTSIELNGEPTNIDSAISAIQSARKNPTELAAVEATSRITPELQFQPRSSAEEVERMSPEEFRTWSAGIQDGITGEAVRLGRSLGPNAADQLTAQHQAAADEARQAILDGRFDDAMTLATKGQFFREAKEAATGTGSVQRGIEKGTIQAQPKRRDDIRGGDISYPAPKYPEAATSERNPWVRETEAPDNTGRVLLVQFSSDLINKNVPKDQAAEYYDNLYSGKRTGYARLQDFWEIPQWMGVASRFVKNADLYVVRDMAEAKQFLNDAGYDRVAFSSLDVNKDMIRELAQDYDGTLDVGGYAEKGYFDDIPNVRYFDSMEKWAADMGVPYEPGVSYRHFEGSEVIPRLTMSQGCKHKCAFCTVEKKITETPTSTVMQQADEIANLGSKLVYLNDKTFGQAGNYQELADVYSRIKEQNPDFEGFIVQTTASQMTRLPAEWLKRSGIKFVELGIETYNDPILKEMKKPATEAVMNKAVNALRDAGITLIPNIIIGLPGETEETYARTLDFLQRNEDIISHANIYNLALYKEAELGKKINTANEGDFNENVLEKSFHTNPEVHRTFAGKMYGFADALLNSKQFQPGLKKPEGNAGRIEEMDRLWSSVPSRGVQQEQRVKRGGAPSEFEPTTREEELGIGPEEVPARGGVAREQAIRRAAIQEQPRPRVESRGKKRDLKLKKGGADGISKAWIMPNGEPVQLGGTWHHDWLAQNPDIQKRFRLKTAPFQGNDIEGAREEALKHGFVRVNYSSNSGKMTVEGREKDWRFQKDPVFDMIEKNIRDIDNIEIVLYDDQVKKVVDAASEKLFLYDRAKDALANIPFITGTEIRQSRIALQPQRREPLFSGSRFFNNEVERVSKGTSFGQTFSSSGEVWEPRNKDVDLVTVASVNVPRSELTPEKIREATAPYADLLDTGNVVAGVYNFERGGQPMTSIDVNAVVPQKFRQNTLEFAKDNDQISIWDVKKGEEVSAGGKGDTVLKSPEQIEPAIRLVVKGQAVDIPRIVNKRPILSPEDKPKIPYSNPEVSKMTPQQLRERFPEAVVPRRSSELVSAELKKAPLLKGAKTEDEAVKRYAEKLVADAKQYQGNPMFEAGSKWYSEFVPLLQAEFGDWAPRMAQLLAATSPQTNPELNFRYAYEALRLWQDGNFDPLIKKYNEGLQIVADNKWMPWLQKEAEAGRIRMVKKPSAATFLAEWVSRYNLKPRKANGALFGAHGAALLKVFADIWLNANRGPKTLQFVSNLTGESHGATIDVWANRTMRRLGYEGYKDRWRIMPKNDAAVTDEDFAFAQKVFSRAAEELGMLPDALQGAMWFAEKLNWYRNGWGSLELGDYKSEIGKIPKLEKRLQKEQKEVSVEPRK